MTALEAGRDLDGLIAEKVMGWQRRLTESNSEQFVVVPPGWTDFSSRYWWGKDINSQVPLYSTDIAAAWQVVERLGLSLMRSANGWVAGILEDDFPDDGFIDCGITHVALAETAPLAICRAALAATGYTDTSPRPPA